MTKFEFPETSPRIFSPVPMVELEAGAAGATYARADEAAIGAAAIEPGAVAAGDAADAGANAGADASDVLSEEIAA